MKQKVVVKVCMNGEKYRSKALKIAVGISGVEAAALQGQDKSQIEVTGDGIDAVCLTTLLRKNVGFAELVSVTPVGEKKEGEKKKEEAKKEEKKEGSGGDKKNEPTVPVVWTYSYNYPYGISEPCVVYPAVPVREYDNNCSIM